MPQIRNDFYAGKTMIVSNEVVKFDENGIGTIQSQELYDEVITFPNFHTVGEDKAEAPKEEAPVEAKAEPTKSKAKADTKKD